MTTGNYWIRKAQANRLSRRRFLGTASAAGVGAAGFALVGCGDDDDDSGWREGSRRGHGGGDGGDDDDDDDDDDCDDDDDDCRGGARNPAPAGTVDPPQNGLFGNGAPPQAQVN